MSKSNYKIPSETVIIRQEIKKSKFIATIGRANNMDSAKTFIDNVSSGYSDASHNCYAFIAGNPFSTTDIGFGDDGEVSGTAGMPMLNILQHKKIGEIVAVITRYFGGTRLGTGGLVRAYSSSLQLALNELKLIELVPVKTGGIVFAYEYENAIRNILTMMKVKIKDINYSENVNINIETSETVLKQLADEIANQTHGRAVLHFKE
ncbi:MAG: YigZ family protein [Thermodesulfobacteriota bacterium]